MTSVETGHRESLDGISRRGNPFHFHTVVGADEQYLSIHAAAQGIRYGEGREDVTSGATAAYQYFGSVLFHVLSDKGQLL